MPQFCTIDDVRAINTRRTYDNSSEPTDAQVEGFVRKANAELTAFCLGRNWTQVQTSGFSGTYPEAWDALSQIAALKAAIMAEAAATAVESGPEQSGHVRTLLRLRKDALDGLLAAGLPGVSSDVPAEPAGRYADMVYDDDTDEPIFEMDETF